jgi:hypothetical protein
VAASNQEDEMNANEKQTCPCGPNCACNPCTCADEAAACDCGTECQCEA